MKKMSSFLIAVISSIVALHAQKLKDSQVPSATKSSFEKKYPGIKGNWERENGNFEVNFKESNKVMSAVIDIHGTIIETETDIPVSNLPETIRAYVKKNYKGSVIHDAAKIEKQNGEINYEAEVNHKDLVFDKDGKFIKETND